MSNDVLKTCSICGLEKPLSSFTHFAGPEGSEEEEKTYGNVCASCRKAYVENQKKPKDREDSTTSASGKQIDAKARIAAEIEKSEERENKKELYREEEEKEEKEEKDIVKKQEISSYEKKQLEGFLEKRSFLSRERKIDKTDITTTAKQAEQVAQKTQNIEQAEKHIESSNEEQQKTGVRLDVPLIAGSLKRTGRFGDFVSWMGKESIIGRAIIAADKRVQAKPVAPGADRKKAGTEDANTPEEFIEKNWTPKSRGSR